MPASRPASRVRPFGLRRLALLCAGLALLLLGGCAARTPADIMTRKPADAVDARQLVLVIAPDWDADHGELRLYERASVRDAWAPAGETAPVMLGRHGLGWGRGLVPPPADGGPVKAEGDGRAPAGLFRLGPAFAYDPAELDPAPRLSVRTADADLLCVDDVASSHYNQWVNLAETPARDWDSAEQMRRTDVRYRFGLWVDHNTGPAAPGAGSCIFLHVWLTPETSTSGCTAMDLPVIRGLIQRLDPAARPVLLQTPRAELARYTDIRP
ncbi:MAG: L,D-transpeptidase [Desulfovibrionaceae bacterium]